MARTPRVVVTGGIGSGKSVVRRLLEDRGFFTIDADSVGHEVLARNGPAFSKVAERWPEVAEEGEIDRAHLASIVFSNPGALAELEDITHPHIFGMIRSRVQGIPDPVAVEIPLVHHGLGNEWTRLVVDCLDSVRIDRLMSRGMTEEDVEARMAAQPKRAHWLAMADVVVPNHADVSSLEAALNRLIDNL